MSAKQFVTLVTGASGFLGKAVTKLLAENSLRTVGLDPRPSPTTHVVDALSDRQKLKMLLTAEKITHIIHAGGVSGPMVLRTILPKSSQSMCWGASTCPTRRWKAASGLLCTAHQQPR